MMIGSWKCSEFYADRPWWRREAKLGVVSVIADADGLEVEEAYSGFNGASGRVDVPANVLMWLMQGVR